MSDEDWVQGAMMDDSAVVELLLHLHNAKRDPPPPLVFPLEWSVRQRRSKPIVPANKKPTPRASPTTPLSWSGATSASGGGPADGFEESSRRPPSTRSKDTAIKGTTANKRSRKKKTLPELKEEETLLLKERRHLKRELANLRVSLEKQRATNESLKRLKLDLESQPAVVASVEAIPDQTEQKVESCDPTSNLPPGVTTVAPGSTTQRQPLLAPNGSSKNNNKHDVKIQGNKFVLPDLNLPLDEEDSNCEVLHRIS